MENSLVARGLENINLIPMPKVGSENCITDILILHASKIILRDFAIRLCNPLFNLYAEYIMRNTGLE